MTKVELLAPAGNLESFYAAVNNGADAVYLGLSDFNARGNIENFGWDNIEGVIRHAHLFGVKVYLTLNILFADDEMKEVLEIAERLLKFGVDAFIVQDLGVASVIKKTFPNSVLHASTQMGICNLEGAQLLKNLGFSRVVLARETRLEEIERIHKNCDIEIEFFIQGALCVSYSGNCYISALQAGASGNRGKCKQFCRLPYTLIDGHEKREGYFLSAKDFCMLEKLEELANAGVCSFKIEGRARRAGYVAQAVASYRNAIASLCKKKIFDLETEKTNLKTAFNRGNFVAGYLDEQKKIDAKIQGHRGVKIGKVIGVNYGKKFNVIKIKSSHQISRGDGLKFLQNESEVASVGVGDVKEVSSGIFGITTTAKVKSGCDVHLTLDVKNEEKLLKNTRKIDIFAEFSAKGGQSAVLKLRENKSGAEIFAQTERICEVAQKQPLTAEEVKTQLCKSSEMFEIKLQKIDLEKVFLRKSELNELRRQAIDKMKNSLVENYAKNHLLPFVKNDVDFTCESVKLPPQEIYLFSNLSQLENIQNKKAKLVYCPQNYNRADIQKTIEKLADFEVYLSLPIFAEEKDLKLFRQIFADNKNLNIFANNIYALNFDTTRKVIASQNLNVFNSHSVAALKNLGVKDIVLSIEQENTLQNSGANLYVVQNYKPVLMNFLHCPFKEHFGSTCAACKFHDGLVYQMQNGRVLQLVRTKALTCNFALCDTNEISKDAKNYGKANYLF